MGKHAAKILFLILCLALGSKAVARNQELTDDRILLDYFAKNNIKAMKGPSGMYYVISRPGTGENAKRGKRVSLLYNGRFIDGKSFDSNMDEHYKATGSLIVFPLGVGKVILGWDYGIKLLNKGSRATFYIPSSLGYGARGNGPVPPNTVLIFDVELVDIQ